MDSDGVLCSNDRMARADSMGGCHGENRELVVGELDGLS